MESSQLMNDIKLESRTSLYYNKFKYKCSFYLWGSHTLIFYKNFKSFLSACKNYKGNSLRKYSKKELEFLVANNSSNLQLFLTLYKERKENNCFIRCGNGGNITIFSNELSYLKSIQDILKIKDFNFYEVEKTTNGIKTFIREPKHNYRLYLRTCKITKQQKFELLETITKNKDLYPSVAFRQWLTQPNYMNWYGTYLTSNYFIDYDNESTLSLFGIFHGNLISKTFKLEQK